MKLMSTIILKERNGQHLSRDSFFSMAGKLQVATFISAYTDIALLNDFLKRCLAAKDGRSAPKVMVFLDLAASGYRSNKDSRKKIEKFSRKIAKNCSEESGIWLVQSGKLFHSKCVLLESTKEAKILIGSLNLTEKAFDGNEELVLAGTGVLGGRSSANAIANDITTAYVPALVKAGKRVPSALLPVRANSIRSLLLSGTMFYEQTESDPFRFNLALPAKFRKIKTQLTHLSGDIQNSVSVMQLLYSAESQYGLGYKNEHFGRSDESPNTKKDKAAWRHLCFETCYGYWCQAELVGDVRTIIDSRMKKRKPHFEKLENSLFSLLAQEEVREKLCEVFSLYVDYLEKNIPDGIKAEWAAAEVKEKWGRWLNRLSHKIKNKTFCDRIIAGIIQAPVPNVWSDPITSAEFEFSFAESILYASQKNQSTKAFSKLLNSYSIDPSLLNDQSEKEILQYLETQIAEPERSDPRKKYPAKI